MWKRVLKISKSLTLNLVILLVLLTIIDPFFSYPDVREIYYRNVSLREFRPLTDVFMEAKEFPGEEFRIRTDKNGFLIGSNEELTNTEIPEIIFYGGSTTECRFVPENRRFPYLVSEALRYSDNGQKVRILNGSFSGNLSIHSTINFLAKGVPQKPNIVVLMHNINDLAVLTKTGSYWVTPKSRAVVREEPINSLKLRDRSSNFLKAAKDLLVPNLYAKAVTLLAADKNGEIDEWKKYRGTIGLPDYAPLESEFEKSIKNFIQLAENNGAQVVLMTQFNRINVGDLDIKGNWEEEDFVRYYDGFNQKIREIAKEENIPLIDLDKEIPPTKQYIYDHVHLNAEGSQLVSEVIAKFFADHFDRFELSSH